MNFDELREFQKEFRNLRKKYRSLPKDLEEFKKVVSIFPRGNSKHFNELTENEQFYVIKARLFCRYLKGSSQRIVYAYYSAVDKIDFIELYFKGNKANEDRSRIDEYLRKHES